MNHEQLSDKLEELFFYLNLRKQWHSSVLPE